MFCQDFKDKLIQFFENHPASNRVAIQIPDKYLPKSVEIYNFFTETYPSKFFFVVSDFSFNDCCVDHISAQHLDANGIVHFGPFCTTNYPVPICFLPELDTAEIVDSKILSNIDTFIKSLTSSKVLIVMDQAEISRNFFIELGSNKKVAVIFAEAQPLETDYFKLFDFYIPCDKSEFNDISLIYIGPHEKLATDLGCIFYKNNSLRIDSKTMSPFEGTISRELTKRSGLIDSIRCFEHVGILVENPNVRLHVQVAQYLQNICAANEIVADIIYVGRLNEMKLGNFADIEFFIHLSCSGRNLFSFIKPIVSPLEFLCAKFDLDFWENQILRDYEHFLNYCCRNNSTLLQNYDHSGDLEGQLVLKSFFELSTQLLDVRKSYSYNGLEINSIDQEMKLHIGAVGNSTSYDYESRK